MGKEDSKIHRFLQDLMQLCKEHGVYLNQDTITFRHWDSLQLNYVDDESASIYWPRIQTDLIMKREKKKMWLKNKIQEWKQKVKDDNYTSGYDYAAGMLLRQERTPIELEAAFFQGHMSDFDFGIQEAITDAIFFHLVKDNRL